MLSNHTPTPQVPKSPTHRPLLLAGAALFAAAATLAACSSSAHTSTGSSKTKTTATRPASTLQTGATTAPPSTTPAATSGGPSTTSVPSTGGVSATTTGGGTTSTTPTAGGTQACPNSGLPDVRMQSYGYEFIDGRCQDDYYFVFAQGTTPATQNTKYELTFHYQEGTWTLISHLVYCGLDTPPASSIAACKH